MARWQGVNVATITEEDVIEEEIGEDGMVETIARRVDGLSTREDGDAVSTSSGSTGTAEGASSRPVSLERPSSFVENEDVDAVNNNSILSSINLEGDSSQPPKTPSSPRRTVASMRRSPSPSSTLPSRKSLARRGSRASGFTLNLSDKFVTELSFYDPCSTSAQRTIISLGIFLATDQVMGDHSVYKVSPVSPLTALKIKPQDRLLKINDISLAGWSHNCVLDFVKNLPLSCLSDQVTPDTTVDLQLCVEYRRSGKSVRSSNEAPTNRRVTARIRVRRKRATVTSVQEGDVRVSYRSTLTRKMRLNGNLPLFLTASNSSSSNTTSLSVAAQGGTENDVCFRLYTYDVAPPFPEGGEVVVIQAPEGDQYLYALNHNQVAFMHGVASDVRSLTQVDVRCFLLHSAMGSDLFRIKSILTDRYVSASAESITLVGQDEDLSLPESTLFQIFSCRQ